MIHDGFMIYERPDLLASTRSMVEFRNVGFRCPGLLVWSLPVARILMAPVLSGITFAAWHDRQLNCSTWTDAAGCKCEVDP
jgi:hypothetical protein